MRAINIFHVLLLFFILSCNDSSLTSFAEGTSSTNPGNCNEIEIKNDSDVFPDDPLFIKEASIEGNILQLTVEYGGGCGGVEFKLLGNASFMESNPVQSNLMLSFQDDDPCKALITKQLCYNLTALANIYRAAYQTSSGIITLHLKGFEGPLNYSF